VAPKGGSASALVGDVQMLGSITISPEGAAGRQRLMGPELNLLPCQATFCAGA